MALKWAVAAGNYSNGAIWNNGTVPVVGDDVRSNGFVVTIDSLFISVLQLSNASTTGVVAGGSFSTVTGSTINANIVASTVVCLSITAGTTVTVNGNSTGGSSTNSHGISVLASATLYFNGTSFAGTGSAASGINLPGISCVLYMVGDPVGGNAGAVNTAGVLVSTATATANITGNPQGGTTGAGVYLASGNSNITGSTFGGAGGVGLYNNGTGISIISNNSTGGSGGAGVLNAGSGTVVIYETAMGGSGGPGARNEANGTLRVKTAKGSPNSVQAGIVGVANTGTTTYERLEAGETYGTTPYTGYAKMKDVGTQNVIVVRIDGGGSKTLPDPDEVSYGIPPEDKVIFGYVYDFGNKTGKYKVAAANQTVAGVPIGVNDVGTAVLTIAQIQSAIWGVDMDSIGGANTTGERFKNLATIQSTGDQITALSPQTP